MNGKPLVRNAANESEVKHARQREDLHQDQTDNDLRFILSTAQGQRFLARLLDKTGLHKTSFTGSSQTFFLEGQRNIGLLLLSDIMRVDPDSYVKLYKINKGV